MRLISLSSRRYFDLKKGNERVEGGVLYLTLLLCNVEYNNLYGHIEQKNKNREKDVEF
jgi:hypothetical protein